ncbi:serine/threonine-protein phosphatase 2A regulatory subunit B'' subunit beta-like [Rhopilema esculentum]|uniref:serine/threonine-protein phosphatase 2A regulatory subunit B'' subunit beta-like n=1 Tax=Rhopilema esculentum TaxID=499914 RepID=UPI0031DC77CA
MIGKTGILSPKLKLMTDDLFLQWFLNPYTQKQLQRDFKKIVGQSSASADVQVSPREIETSNNILGSRPASPPATPPLALTPPGKSPSSPRRRTTSSLSSSSGQVDQISSKRNSLKNSLKQPKRPEVIPGCAKNLPQFYFPFGKPSDEMVDEKAKLRLVSRIFAKLTNGKASCSQLVDVVQILGLPLYWKYPLYKACGGHSKGYVTFQELSVTWEIVLKTYHDPAARLFKFLAPPEKDFLTKEDFNGFIQDVIETHPGLQFLMDAPEFHSRYITTVISRIFYCINRSWSGRISLAEFKKSNFQQVLISLEEEDDINQVVDYFSYEHFYVIYCKFWELDTDHDLIIDKKDLSRYSNGALSTRIIDRIFSGCVTSGKEFSEDKMSYADFVWFLISEVDKKQPTSIEYWFRCMDLDGDGIISMYELEYFYNEQLEKMQRLGIETLAFPDCLCLVIDMVNPAVEGKITLRDLRRCKTVNLFFDTFFNLDRWLEYEQRDPFQSARDADEFGPGNELSDWEKFAMQEYEILVNEEGASQDFNYEDDFDMDDDLDQDDIAALKGENNVENNLTKSLSYFTGTGGSSDDEDSSTFY